MKWLQSMIIRLVTLLDEGVKSGASKVTQKWLNMIFFYASSLIKLIYNPKYCLSWVINASFHTRRNKQLKCLKVSESIDNCAYVKHHLSFLLKEQGKSREQFGEHVAMFKGARNKWAGNIWGEKKLFYSEPYLSFIWALRVA